MFRSVVTSALFLLLLHPPGFSQDGGSGGSQGQSSEGGGAKGFQRPIFISGRVMMSDGSAPDGSVTVDLICEGMVVRQAYTGSGGDFTIQVNFGRGAKNEAHSYDASVHRGIAAHTGAFNTDQTGPGALGSSIGSVREDRMGMSFCELKAAKAGYLSDTISLGLRQAHDDPMAGVITLHPTLVADGAAVSTKTLKAPRKARQAFEKASREMKKEGKKRDTKKVLRELRKAVKEYPEFSEAWLLMGQVQLELGEPEDARKALEKATESEPGFTLPYLSLAQLELDAGQIERAAQLSNRATILSPDHPRGHYLNALTNSALGNRALAEASARRVHDGRFVAEFPAVHYVLGWALSQRGEYAQAASEYRHYLELLPDVPAAADLRDQLHRWESFGLIDAPGSAQPDP